MNDEYLWQKTGTDPEIEKLEKKLDVFRYRETPLNIPVVENVVETARVPRWRISLAFAFAASAMAGVLAAVVLFKFQTRPRLKLCSFASPELETASPPPAAAPIEEKKTTTAPKVVPQFAEIKRSKIIRTQSASERRPKFKDVRPSTSVATLSPEERYAYRQLMLALSISSSKLKLVEDSIKGNENPENTSTDKR
jgi:hypothetical protein